ncbi:hypothetical protein GCM10023075_70430 [Streptosporangium album]
MVKTQPIGSWFGVTGLRAEVVVFVRAVEARLAGAVRDEEDPDRPEDLLAEVLPEAPLDVRVAMVMRLARRMVNRMQARRDRYGPYPPAPAIRRSEDRRRCR